MSGDANGSGLSAEAAETLRQSVETLGEENARLLAKVSDLTPDAERWRALLSARSWMHYMGSAGFKMVPKDGNEKNKATVNMAPTPTSGLSMHFGIEFWDYLPKHVTAGHSDSFEREILVTYVDEIRARQARGYYSEATEPTPQP